MVNHKRLTFFIQNLITIYFLSVRPCCTNFIWKLMLFNTNKLVYKPQHVTVLTYHYEHTNKSYLPTERFDASKVPDLFWYGNINQSCTIASDFSGVTFFLSTYCKFWRYWILGTPHMLPSVANYIICIYSSVFINGVCVLLFMCESLTIKFPK